MTPDLSVVIPAWNRSELTRGCLESLRACTLALDIVVVDNGSRDDTVAMIEGEFPEVRLIKNPRNLGVTEGWRQGYAAARAETICISNNDLAYETGSLEKLVKTLHSADWIGVTCPETYKEDDKPVPAFKYPSFISPDAPPARGDEPLRIGYVGWSFVFDRVDFPENFDPKFFLWYQDKDFLYTLMYKRRSQPPFRWPVPGKVPVIVPGARVDHIYNASHDQLNPEWMKRQTDKEKDRFNRKWRGYRGNAYEQEVRWADPVHVTPATQEVIAGQDAFPQDPDKDLSALVSIIIPIYNRIELLKETIASVVAQTHHPIELLLIDDGSDIDLAEMVIGYLSEFKGDWKFIRLSRNSGPGIARRVGLSYARGEFVQYLDSDDILIPEKLAVQVEQLREHSDMIMTYALTAYGTPSDAKGVLGRTDQQFDRILPETMERIIWQTSSCLWRREPTADPNLWLPLFAAEDITFDFLVGLQDQSIEQTPSEIPLAYKRVHEQSISYRIAEDVAYQQEILKAYDYMWWGLVNSPHINRFRRDMARRYVGKIMQFLVMRRYWEADYCFRQARLIEPTALPLMARAAYFVRQILGIDGIVIAYSMLRRWWWLKKVIGRKIYA